MDEPVWLDRTLLEVVHTDQILEHGGRLGIRDEGLLESALARPIHEWTHDSRIYLATLAAAYGFGIAKNHPFIDGNKRASLMAIDTFLAINDLELETPEPEAVSVILGVAEGSATEDELGEWIRSRLIPWIDRAAGAPYRIARSVPHLRAVHTSSEPSEAPLEMQGVESARAPQPGSSCTSGARVLARLRPRGEGYPRASGRRRAGRDASRSSRLHRCTRSVLWDSIPENRTGPPSAVAS